MYYKTEKGEIYGKIYALRKAEIQKENEDTVINDKNVIEITSKKFNQILGL